MTTVTALDLATEIVRVSTLATLSDAARTDSLSDVVGVHRSVLAARLGPWTDTVEARATRILGVACEDALDEDATEESLIDYLHREVRS